MAEQLGDLTRTHTCGALTTAEVGNEVRVSGWVHRKRDHGDLVFIDLAMPGLDGCETMQRIRRCTPAAHMIFVALTGFAEDDNKARAYQNGFDFFVAEGVVEQSPGSRAERAHPGIKAATPCEP